MSTPLYNSEIRLGSYRRNHERSNVTDTWRSFQRLRIQDQSFSNTTSSEVTLVPITKHALTTRNTSSVKVHRSSYPEDSRSKATGEQFVVSTRSRNSSPRKSSSKGESRWARSWANNRAQQALLTRNAVHQTNHITSQNLRQPPTFTKLPTKNDVKLGAKSAAAFDRLKSIYNNLEDRDKRIRNITKRINNIQKEAIKNEVNKSIHEFTIRSKEDEKNRRELRLLRDRFSETKKYRLRHMHVSRHAVDLPSVSRVAYGLPQEGKEFSRVLSPKKTTDEITNMWKMAFIRRNCVETFLRRISEKKTHQLPHIKIKQPENATPKIQKDSRVLTNNEASIKEFPEPSSTQKIESANNENAVKLQQIMSEAEVELLSTSEDEDI